MRLTVRVLANLCLLTTSLAISGAVADAQEQSTWSTHDFRKWVEQFPVPGSQLQTIGIARVFSANEEIRPWSGQSVIGLGISGRVQFTSTRGLVRVIVVDNQLQEYLVYETYPLIAGAESFQIRNACRETCVLPPTVLVALKVELVDASLYAETIITNQLMTTAGARAQSAAPWQDVKAAQEREIIDALNRQIKAKGLKWVAGETPLSRLSYSEKKTLLACLSVQSDAPPNLQGAEYYKGGIFEIGAAGVPLEAVTASSTLTDSFDWRSRHGANRPGSPYYDGDATGGGWMTSIKNQRCADCWAHSALGATEALANLYFNQHLDLDLSEQELVSCSGAGSCQYGGNTGLALSYVQTAGVVDEACFPESGRDESCGNCCASPRERITITGFESLNPSVGADNIKRMLISSGPLPFGIISWWHGLVLAGYRTEMGTGDTIWILKNSWGTGWGENGYGYVKVPLNDIYLTYNLHNPVVSLVTPHAVACRDADGDGYFNWGISNEGASACGGVPTTEDCDDSDPTLALLTHEGRCTAPPDTTAPVISMIVNPSRLWPPTGKFIPVMASGTITDTESGVNASSATYKVDDEYGRVQLTGAVLLNANGSYTIALLLEADRQGDDEDGRQYVITVTALDEAGNSASMFSVALVPRDMRSSAK
jgi:hypothetical protein